MHLTTIFFALLVLNLYLLTDRRIGADSGFKVFYALTLFVNLFASLCRMSILSVPAAVFIHILFCSKGKTRYEKYRIWSPLFAIYMVYPLLLLSIGESRSMAVLNPLLNRLGFILRSPVFSRVFSAIGPAARFLPLFLSGLFTLYLLPCFKSVFRFKPEGANAG